MSTVPPLPKSNHEGDCPWCKHNLLDQWYENAVPSEAERLAAGKTCPNCEKPIAVQFEETITYTPVITATRSPADIRYMALKGISEGPRQHG